MKSFANKVYKRVSLISLSAVLAVSSLATLGTSMLTQTASATAGSAVVYDALPSDNPTNTNYTSIGNEAYSASEIGDYVHLGGTNRILNTATVTLSDWAKYSDYASNATYSGNNTTWSMPMTLNVYSNQLGANGVPDHLLATTTKTVTIPWRPESDPSCGATSNGTGWKIGGTCYDWSGIASNVTFDLSSLNVTLPSDVIVSVAYNTQHHGYTPTGLPGPYNSLNVAIPENQAVTVGADDSANNIFWNTSYAGFYTDGGAAGVNTFRQDTGWSPYGTVALELTATAPVAPVAPTGLQFQNGSNIIPSGTTFNSTTITNNTDLVWSDGSSEATNAYQTQITYPDGTTSTQWTGTKNLWIGKTAYVNNFFGQKGDGVYSYVVKSRSAATGLWSNWSAPVSLSYDTHSPTAQFTVTPPQYVNGNFQVSGSANDNVKLSNVFFDVRDPSDTTGNSWRAGCVGSVVPVYTNGGKDATISCDINTSSLIVGNTYTLRIHAGDYAGYGGGQSTTFIVDKTGPTITIKSDSTGSNGAYSITNFKLYDQYNVANYSINGGTVHNLTPNQWSDANGISVGQNGGVYGDNTITAMDLAGNSTTMHFTLDNVAPTITAKSDSIGSNGIFSLVNFSLYDQYQITGFSVNGGLLHNLTPNQWSDANGISVGQNGGVYGDNTISAYDAAGNIGTYNFVLDNVKPTVTVKDSSIGSTTTNTYSVVDFKLYDQYNVASYSVNGGTVHNLTPNQWSDANGIAVGINGGVLGANTIAVTDQAGNTQTYAFTLDNVPPVVTISSPTAGAYGFIKTVNIDANIGDAVSYSVYVNGIDVYDGTGVYTPYALTVTDGTYNMYIEAKDAAGNVGTSATTTITVDDTAPTLKVTGYAGTSLTPTITGTTDSSTDVVTVDGIAATVNPDGTWTYTFPTQTVGTHTYNVVSTDTFGNAKTQQVTVTVNAVPATQTTPATTTTTVTPAAAQTTNNGGQAVLGASTTTPNNTTTTNKTNTPSVLGTSTTKTPATNPWSLAWYWWLLIIAAIVALLWAIISAVRRRGEEQ